MIFRKRPSGRLVPGSLVVGYYCGLARRVAACGPRLSNRSQLCPTPGVKCSLCIRCPESLLVLVVTPANQRVGEFALAGAEQVGQVQLVERKSDGTVRGGAAHEVTVYVRHGFPPRGRPDG